VSRVRCAVPCNPAGADAVCCELINHLPELYAPPWLCRVPARLQYLPLKPSIVCSLFPSSFWFYRVSAHLSEAGVAVQEYSALLGDVQVSALVIAFFKGMRKRLCGVNEYSALLGDVQVCYLFVWLAVWQLASFMCTASNALRVC